MSSLFAEENRRVADNVRWVIGAGAPINGSTGVSDHAGPASLYFDITNAQVYIQTGTLAVPAWTILTANLAPGSVTTAILADLSVSTAKIIDANVTAAKIAAGAIDNTKLAAAAVQNAAIAAGAVDNPKLAANAVQTTNITDLNVTTTKIADSNVTAAKIVQSTFKQFTGTISAVDIVGTGAGQFGNANGYPLIPGQGAHNVVELISVIAFYKFNTAAYTAGGNTTVNRSAGAGALTGLISAANFCGAAGNKVAFFMNLATAGINLTENEGINLVSSAAFTQPGTAAGTISWVANCRIHATGF